jgi:hypothetical protein
MDQCQHWEDNCENDCALGGDPPHCRDACSRGQSQCEEGCRGLPDANDKEAVAKYRKKLEEKAKDPIANFASALIHFRIVDGKDTTSIGTIIEAEFMAFFKGHPCIDPAKEFAKLDKNGKPGITIDEIDPDVNIDSLRVVADIDPAYLNSVISAVRVNKK